MIYIIIPVHNRITKTISCLDALYHQKRKDICIVVVDDGSSDGTQFILKKTYPNLVILTGLGSLFWTGSVRLGIDYALSVCSREDWILLVNNDVQVSYNAIDELLAFAIRHKRKVIVNALSVDLINKNTIIKSGTIVKSWFFNSTYHVHNGEKIENLPSKKEIEVDLLTGRCLLHPVEVFEKIGNYNSVLFPHYGGDDEFTARAKLFGFRLFVLPLSVVYLDQKKDPYIEKKLYPMLFGVRSSSNIVNKWKFTRVIVPWYAQMSYYLIAVLKSLYVFVKSK